ncbi:MAG TPA: DUF2243 domain-containing protein [Actinomycetota bacterium]|nr:DUF2243 domain-containing protein [Actinomycetota bacterium]
MTVATARRQGEDTARARARSITLPSILLGIGLGGFFDGIVLHQILQWHHMLTSTGDHPATTVAGLEVNTLWDGLFHMTTYVFVVVGVFMIWARAREGALVWSWRTLLGWSLFGWGLFNLVEGIVDHHILQIHHVRPGPDELAYDLGFLASGAVLLLVGWLIARTDRGLTRA